MGFRINTNIDAMSAHRNMLGTSGSLSKSLERLSSGLRINRAADDASGMTIADSLRAQATGLGQAMRNAGDAISLVQVADGALEESINIVTTIRTKAIQAASDGQNTVSRAAIQADVNKLLEEMNIIADTTAFNGQTLLKGNFTNKSFQVGAYANQTVSVSIDNADASHVGRLATINTTTTQTNLKSLDSTSNFVQYTNATLGDGTYAQLAANDLTINGVDLAGNLAGQGVSQLSAEGLAAAINRTTETTSVKATAETSWAGTGTIVGGTIADGGLVINGINVGAVTVVANDADGALVSAINAKQAETGVSASVSADGKLTLTAADGRNIAIYNGGAYSATSFDNTLGSGFVDNRTSVSITAAYVADGASEINVGGVNITYNAASDTATTRDNIFAALSALGSEYTVTQSAPGAATVITRTDGKDINLVASTEVAADTLSIQALTPAGANEGAAQTEALGSSLVTNSSQHGSVTLNSTGNIALTGDQQTMEAFGFNSATSQVAAASGGIADADVTTASAAQTTIQRADSALEALDKIRSGLGSAQNQVEATLRNISVTRVNIQSAESAVRDVDFADESSTFAKMNILVQAGSYALSQANAVQQNIMTLLR
ncbi:flagellin N-terminal helical domain-containing protein [Thiovibrio frasassiensis]|uniref:Flagellin n=1 Tax=Thiovibrio frasassiensis TaxID=2984131 RepID=A0A9X4MEG1_9BACT|nr:flagellin [Thiovibrio frasassiensis]MDG4474790.1 flagellin [Thiovibrio frasassiensis]